MISDICIKYLIILINAESRDGNLVGNNPNERYLFFEEKYSKTGIAYKKLTKKNPNIQVDLSYFVNSYTSLVRTIQEKYEKDSKILFKKGLIRDGNEKLLSITIKGDFHNGEAVAEVVTERSTVMFKPRSINNEIFFYELLTYLSTKYTTKDIFSFKELLVLDKETYGWVEFLVEEPVSSVENIYIFYERLGYILAISYMLNLSDLHFENIVCKGAVPSIVDLETLFSMSVVKQTNINDATSTINNIISNSVYSTSLLPVLGEHNLFGGDASGIMGGKFNKEELSIQNPFSDEIKLMKKYKRVEYKKHLPFVLKNGTKVYANPQNYKENLIHGFNVGYELIMNNKKDIISFVKEKGKEVNVRILARNTMEYSALIQASKSPAYSTNREYIYNKLFKFNKNLPETLIESEIIQLKKMSIPIFICKADSNIVKDPDFNNVYILHTNPLNEVSEKINNADNNDMNLQKKLIDFSIESQSRLFTDGNKFPQYRILKGDEGNLDSAIINILDIIEDNATVSAKDKSVNWMSLGISSQEIIQLESMDNDVYKGISGIGLSLIEYYEYNPNDNTKKLLDLIYQTITSSISHKMDTKIGIDYSFYNGITGEIAFLNKYNIFFNKNNVILENYFSICIERLQDNTLPTNDIIGGEAGLIIYLYELKDNNIYYQVIIDLGESLIKRIDYKMQMASYAHGNSGLMTALLYVYQISKQSKYMELFEHLWENEDKLKLQIGWKDYRKKDNTCSTYWCHGASGQAVARMQWLLINKKNRYLSIDKEQKLLGELNELINLIIQEGLTENNFCLCHGIVGNLMILNYYQTHFKKHDSHLKKIIKDNFLSVCKYGLEFGWICGLGDLFYSYGIMTGLSGILYSLIRYKKGKEELGVLSLNLN
uniref:LmgM-posttranslational modifications of prelacticin LMG n=1 Tax=Lactococcus lactis subsp. lactis TaxID=1360 RepID=A0A0M7BIH9_LACLL|nr:LmgM-posttranslational modifications of prelacticin LMG [Lactococcus lactis subsp. lactis]